VIFWGEVSQGVAAPPLSPVPASGEGKEEIEETNILIK
jgi:hypothetical protein